MQTISRSGAAARSGVSSMVAASGGAPEAGAGLHRPAMLRREIGHGIGAVRQMPDDPGIVHGVARRGDLGMVDAEDLDGIVVPDLEHGLAQLGMAIALGPVETVMVNFGLRMV